jgi:hypothetical protein
MEAVMRHSSARSAAPLASVVLFTLTSCTTSRPEPVTPEAVDHALPGAPTAASPEQEVEVRPTEAIAAGGRASLAAVALAGRVTVATVKTVGSTVAGRVQGGADGASEAWEKGSGEAGEVARREASAVREAAEIQLERPVASP